MKYLFTITVVLVAMYGCTSLRAEDRILLTHKPEKTMKSPIAERPLVIAVIDTGFGVNGLGEGVKLCKYWHKDFTNGPQTVRLNVSVPIPLDRHGHGTNIAGLISKYADQGKRPYCIVVIKYYDPEDLHHYNSDTTIQSIKYATSIRADIINYSGGGIAKDSREIEAVKQYIDEGGTFIAASGNEGHDLKDEPFYPATDDNRIVVVGNVDSNYKEHKASNYGERVNCWENGVSAEAVGVKMTGTSQATAIVTGKFIANIPCNSTPGVIDYHKRVTKPNRRKNVTR